MEKTQNRCLSGRRTRRGARLSVVLLSGRENLLWSRRYHLAIGLFANMRPGLAIGLGSHRSRNNALGHH
jgi:hypothetical protein